MDKIVNDQRIYYQQILDPVTTVRFTWKQRLLLLFGWKCIVHLKIYVQQKTLVSHVEAMTELATTAMIIKRTMLKAKVKKNGTDKDEKVKRINPRSEERK